MSVKDNAVFFDDDNPEWTEEDFAQAKRGDAIPEHVREAFETGKRGRPMGSTKHNTKKSITLRLDPDVIDGWRASGRGWQARMNDALRAAMLW